MKASFPVEASADRSAASTNRFCPYLASLASNVGVFMVNVDDAVDRYKNIPPPFPLDVEAVQDVKRKSVAVMAPPLTGTDKYNPPPHPPPPTTEQPVKLTSVTVVVAPEGIACSITHPFPLVREMDVNDVLWIVVSFDVSEVRISGNDPQLIFSAATSINVPLAVPLSPISGAANVTVFDGFISTRASVSTPLLIATNEYPSVV
jgi:hypothetical protein